ncbi:MAG: hypothetical protein ACREQF_07265 [Candidatus Binataceae bacterium]
MKLALRKIAAMGVRGLRISAVGLSSILVLATSTHAHSGMAGPDEVGPPIVASVALGIISYWLVVLWPADKPDRRMSPGHSRSRLQR